MPGEFDPTLKALVETVPADWLPLTGRPRRRVTLHDADIASMISGAADKVLRVHDRPPYLLHLDFQAGHDSASLPARLKLYNSALEYRHNLPVLSVAVILRPQADSPQLTGLLERSLAGEGLLVSFRYKVLRVWELPAEQLLEGGLGTLPLAPVSAVARSALPGVIRRMHQRLEAPAARRYAPELWTATYVLLGLRYDKGFAQSLLREVLSMKESTTYQAILQEGRAEGRAKGRAEGLTEGLTQGRAEGLTEGARLVLLELGEDRFGAPDAEARARIEAIGDVGKLKELARSVSRVGSWRELLASQARPRRNGKRKA
jgi:predicted transposase YdaD